MAGNQTQTFNALYTAADTDAVAYRNAVLSGNAVLAAATATRLRERFPNLTLPEFIVTPGGPDVFTGDVVPGVDDNATV